MIDLEPRWRARRRQRERQKRWALYAAGAVVFALLSIRW